MKWEDGKTGYENYLTLEKSLSLNSIAAYINDINKLITFLDNKFKKIAPEKVKLLHLKNFVEWLNERDVSPRTQARTISGIKSVDVFDFGFFRNLEAEQVVGDVDDEATDILVFEIDGSSDRGAEGLTLGLAVG